MSNLFADERTLKPRTRGWKIWSTKKKLAVIAATMLLLIILAIALGVGLGLGLRKPKHGQKPSPPSTTWQPAVGTSWQIELLYPLNNTSFDAAVYDIDLFDNPSSTISNLHDLDRKVVCYLSAGTYESWRPDANKFHKSDLGNKLDEWDERWIDVTSKNVRKIMQDRLDLAQSMGCDGVDPDNVDGYANNNGLGLTRADAVDYVNWFADEAHSRGMSLGLKNAGDIISDVLDNMQWSVNEQCAQYRECRNYDVFTKAGKPVFHIEYPKGQKNNHHDVSTAAVNSACDFPDSGDFSTLIKNTDLDYWYQLC